VLYRDCLDIPKTDVSAPSGMEKTWLRESVMSTLPSCVSQRDSVARRTEGKRKASVGILIRVR
jgi:hypothetical protein